MITFVIPGKPQPKQRPRVLKTGITYTPKETRQYEQKVRDYFPGGYYEKDTPLQLHVDAYFPIPKSWSKDKQDAALKGQIYPTGRPDIDNIAKIASDALNGVAYDDDAQIVQVITTKRYSTNPRLVITIQSMSEIIHTDCNWRLP